MEKTGLILGASLEKIPGEVTALTACVLRGEMLAQRVIATPEGDIRYWGVDVSQYSVLGRLQAFGEHHFRDVTGKLPRTSIMMVNHIDAKWSPNGSGDGWHRDSFRAQYKAIAYLTDVERASQGAFCYLPNSNLLLYRVVSAAYWVLTRGNRYSDRLIDSLLQIGVQREVVLSKAGIPFFVNTSLIHRGLPISEGYRIAATVYMFGGEMTEQFRILLETGIDRKPDG